jgi:hypothetical protein
MVNTNQIGTGPERLPYTIADSAKGFLTDAAYVSNGRTPNTLTAALALTVSRAGTISSTLASLENADMLQGCVTRGRCGRQERISQCRVIRRQELLAS